MGVQISTREGTKLSGKRVRTCPAVDDGRYTQNDSVEVSTGTVRMPIGPRVLDGVHIGAT